MTHGYKGVIFDFNGTLFLDHDKHVKAWNQISLLLRNIPIQEDELYNHINGVPNEQVIQYLLHNEATSLDIEKYSKLKESFYRDFCRQDIKSFHLLPGVTTFFSELKAKGIPFTIASASIKENIDFFVTSFELDCWIEPKHIIYDNGTYVNKVAMFTDAAQRLGVMMEDILVFEDSINGIKDAYAAGCRNIIVVDSTNRAREYLNMPGVIQVITNFHEVLTR